jgi:hypothetical protein
VKHTFVRLTTLRGRLVKIDVKIVQHARYVVLQRAEAPVAAPASLAFGTAYPFTVHQAGGRSRDQEPILNAELRLGRCVR